MGVLEPLKSKTSEMQEIREDYLGMIEMTLENLESYAGAILNDRHDIMGEEEPFFFLVWRDGDVMGIDSIEELEKEKSKARELKDTVLIESLRSSYGEACAEKWDVEPEQEDPIGSYGRLEEVSQNLDDLIETVDRKVAEKYGLEIEDVATELDIISYKLFETFYTFGEEINALPLLEGVAESQKNIEMEKEGFLDTALKEHTEHKESVKTGHDPVKLPKNPVDWDSLIEEENIRDYMDISDLPSVTYGNSLHLMMEELCEDVDRVEPEYLLHFRNPGKPKDTPRRTRIDNTLRPDALDDLFVYEFKHMPWDQRELLKDEGDLSRNQKFIDNVRQVNTYLNELDMPAGMLVYVSSDMEVKEYVVERHEVDDWSNYEQEFDNRYVHDREDYNFDNLLKESSEPILKAE